MLILPDTGHVSLLASGGADSTILAYMLAQQFAHRNPRLFLLGSQEHNVERLHRIALYIAAKTGYTYPIHVFREKTYIRPTVEKVLGVYQGVVITGCNKVVENKFTPTVYIKGETPPVRGPAFSEYHLRPFIDMDKIQVLQLYKDYGVVDLLHKTRSCGVATGVCGGCYFCMERAWACDILDIPNIQDK